jgi:hypothetical protein
MLQGGTMSNRPVLILEEDRLTRKAGWFWRRSIDLSAIRRIVACNVPTLVIDTRWIVFEDGLGADLSVCESDEHFSSVVAALEPRFPGIGGFAQAEPAEPFRAKRVELWRHGVVAAR